MIKASVFKGGKGLKKHRTQPTLETETKTKQNSVSITIKTLF